MDNFVVDQDNYISIVDPSSVYKIIYRHLRHDPFNQNSIQSDREKWSTPKVGPVFSKLF